MSVCTMSTQPMVPATVALVSRLMQGNAAAPAPRAAAPANDASHNASIGASSGELATMCHEILNPLNAVLGFVELLGADVAMGEKQRRHLRAIEQAGQHIHAIVEETLAAARQHARSHAAADEAVALGPLVESVVQWMEPDAARAGVELCAPPTDAVVRGDAHQLREVLLNLVSNAVKYNHRGGRVSVHAGVETGQGRVRIEVHDTGPGISAEAQARLFQPFERLGAERTEVQGNGIGLYITRQLVQGMGGAMDVRSEPGLGSTFSVCLRGAAAAAMQEARA